MRGIVVGLVVLVAATVSATPAIAGPDDDLRDEARSLLKSYEQQGWPQSRCSLNAFMEGSIVVVSTGSLKLGDEILAVNGSNVDGSDRDAVPKLLGSVSPDATAEVELIRDGQRQDASVQCSDASIFQEQVLAGLKAASRRKWYDCIDLFEPPAQYNVMAAYWRYRCASVSRRASNYDLKAMLAVNAKNSVQRATYYPDSREAVVKALIQQRGALYPSDFEALMDVVYSWDNGAMLIADLTPDWAYFKRRTESRLISRLIDPDSARIEWPYGFIYGTWNVGILFNRETVEGYWTCGLINARNRMGGYTGSQFFVAVLSEEGVPKYVDMGEHLDLGCSNSVKLLPPPPPEFFAKEASEASPAEAQSPSLAQELQQLAELHESGALTDEEYSAAKDRLLNAPK